MGEGSPQRAKGPLPSRLERLQGRTLRVRPRKGANLTSVRDLGRDRANRLLKVEHHPSLVEPPLPPWSSWVASALGTQQILGQRGE